MNGRLQWRKCGPNQIFPGPRVFCGKGDKGVKGQLSKPSYIAGRVCVRVRPFISPVRTTFLWQIRTSVVDQSAEQWEAEEDLWRCLPAHWQAILNKHLASFKGRVQDAEAVYRHRLEQHGPDDQKTKNSLKKFESLRSGEDSEDIILICKKTMKEASPDVYSKSVLKGKADGKITLKVSCSKFVNAYRLSMRNLTLELVQQGEEQTDIKSLRIVSVTGASREVQELRVHLNALSLSSSKVLDSLPGKNKSTKKISDQERHCNAVRHIFIYTHV